MTSFHTTELCFGSRSRVSVSSVEACHIISHVCGSTYSKSQVIYRRNVGPFLVSQDSRHCIEVRRVRRGTYNRRQYKQIYDLSIHTHENTDNIIRYAMSSGPLIPSRQPLLHLQCRESASDLGTLPNNQVVGTSPRSSNQLSLIPSREEVITSPISTGTCSSMCRFCWVRHVTYFAPRCLPASV